MSENGDDGGDAGRRGPLGGLDEEVPPPAAAEDRIVRALRARGLIRRRRFGRKWLMLSAGAAAAAVLFAAGFAAGSRATLQSSSRGPRFALFLSPLPDERGSDERARESEYREWAAHVRETGRFIAGERLEKGARVVSDAGESGSAAGSAAPYESAAPSGYFVISAASLADALAVARTCPHVSHGGRVVVRAIAPG